MSFREDHVRASIVSTTTFSEHPLTEKDISSAAQNLSQDYLNNKELVALSFHNDEAFVEDYFLYSDDTPTKK